MSDVTLPRLKDQFARLDWSRAHCTSIQMRYSDTDAMGHVNNAVYMQYLETSRVVMMRDVQGGVDQVRSVVARVELDYAQEIRLGQRVEVQTLVERFGGKSWSNLSRILADDQPSAFARVVEVRVDEQNQAVEVGQELRELLAPYQAVQA